MTTTDLLLSIVTSLLSRVPVLIALVLGLVLVWRTPPVAARRAALAALWLLLACSVAEVTIQAVALWLMQQGSVARISMVMSVSRLVLVSVQGVALSVLVWTLASSLQRARPTPEALQ
ncbi:hypothetical protein VDG39_12275 [Xanthomonas campestris pv. raphani]|uniref:hypothetical protein n=1 Tax=Xanthomonas campestris TaxID=339 RepID=UPI002B222CC2|nr:hypothetical protein [Xanthomonas campestris]MEA9913475.1 hypothetical protein [Xanthomonas campestris pv. raphani]